MAPASSAEKPLRVVFVGAQDSGGGAARAATRIFNCLWERQDTLGLDVSMRVRICGLDHPAIQGGVPTYGVREYTKYVFRTAFRTVFPRRRSHSPQSHLISPAREDTGLGRELNESPADIVVLNWLGAKTLSVGEIGRLGKKVVWQLHDMWMFSGAEHYREHDRAAHGYPKDSRPSDEWGPDVNREVFLRKKRLWKEKVPIIVPSTWLGREAHKSQLTKDWPVFVQPYPLDTDFWTPQDKTESRRHIGLADDALVILFGAASGTRYAIKGGDLLLEAVRILSQTMTDQGRLSRIVVAIFGEEAEPTMAGDIPVMFLGELTDSELRKAHSAADVLVVPSRIENLALVALEGHACGVPLVVSNGTGLTDVVEDGVTGFHATKNDPKDFAQKIQRLLENDQLRQDFSQAARRRALDLWQPDPVAERYASILRHAAGRGSSIVDPL
jgi:glycosyltransferase involved in cell wall biosynthesis